MSNKLVALFLALLVLVGAMSLKTIVTAHADGSVTLASGGAPMPPMPYKSGGAPMPPMPYKSGGAPMPPMPY
jgi:hypothetical protein